MLGFMELHHGTREVHRDSPARLAPLSRARYRRLRAAHRRRDMLDALLVRMLAKLRALVARRRARREAVSRTVTARVGP